MDFAQPHVYENGVAARSGIRLVPLDDDSDNNDDNDDNNEKDRTEKDENQQQAKKKRRFVRESLIRAANEAATDLFLGSNPRPCSNAELVNAQLYPEHVLPVSRTRLIEEGSLVVLFESFDAFAFCYVQRGQVFQNRNGVFSHDDFIGKPYGSQVRSTSHWGLGFLYLLQPTPELWSRSLRHRTQIVYELDAALVVSTLQVRPNQVVVESGTGSGAMSHFLLRAIAPFGKLHTFEYNQFRVQEARGEFQRNGVSHLVQVHWRDVCAQDETEEAATEEEKEEGKEKQQEEAKTTPGKDDQEDKIQTESLNSEDKTGEDDNDKDKDTKEEEGNDKKEKMGRGGFGPAVAPGSVHAIFLDLPEPWLAIPHCTRVMKPGCGRLASYSPCVEQCQRVNAALRDAGFHSLRTTEVRQREWYIDELPFDGPPTQMTEIPGPTPPTPAAMGAATAGQAEAPLEGREEKDETMGGKSTNGGNANSNGNGNGIGVPPETNNTMICSRQAPNLKGHTAFLTFATFGGIRRQSENGTTT